MPGLIQGLEIAKRAPLSNLSYVAAIGHNAARPEASAWGAIGVGITVASIHDTPPPVERVSLDEEMANTMKFQHACDTADRVISSMCRALDVVISRMGVVGR